MVNITKTLLDTLHKKFQMLSLQSINDTKGFKLILSVAILQDLIEWSENVGVSPQTISKLTKYRDSFIAKNPLCFTTSIDHSDRYTNVNIPDFEHVYQRVQDDPEWISVLPDDCCGLEEVVLGGVISEGSCVIPENDQNL